MNFCTCANFSGIAVTLIKPEIGLITRLEPSAKPTLDAPGTTPAPHRVYNIGNHTPVPLDCFISVIENAVGRRAVKRMLPMQAGDVPATYADVDDLTAAVGFAPRTSIEDGIRTFVDWYMDYYQLQRA